MMNCRINGLNTSWVHSRVPSLRWNSLHSHPTGPLLRHNQRPAGPLHRFFTTVFLQQEKNQYKISWQQKIHGTMSHFYLKKTIKQRCLLKIPIQILSQQTKDSKIPTKEPPTEQTNCVKELLLCWGPNRQGLWSLDIPNLRNVTWHESAVKLVQKHIHCVYCCTVLLLLTL